MSEETTKKCPKCNATLSKRDTFCGYCGTNLDEQQSSFYQSSQTPPSSTYPQGTVPPSGYRPMGEQPPPGYQQYPPTYGQPGATVVYLDEKQLNRMVVQAKVRAASTYAWFSFCPSAIFSVLFFIFSLVNGIQALRLSNKEPIVVKAVRNAIIIGVIGVILNITLTIIALFVWDFGLFVI